MTNKTPWYIYPPDEPKQRQRGDDPLAMLVAVLLMAIFALVAFDHALYRVWTIVASWCEALSS